MKKYIASLCQRHKEIEAGVHQHWEDLQTSGEEVLGEETILFINGLLDSFTVSSLADELISHSPVVPRELDVRVLRKCVQCPCGPFERLPSSGCPGCNWDEQDFSKWAVWTRDSSGDDP